MNRSTYLYRKKSDCKRKSITMDLRTSHDFRKPNYSLFTIFLFAFTLLLISSCVRDKLTDDWQLSLQDEELLSSLEKAGFDAGQLEITEDYVLLDGDGVWEKQGLIQDLSEDHIDPKNDDPEYLEYVENRQRGLEDGQFFNAVSRTRVRDVKYFIRYSVYNDCGQRFVDAVNQAADEWNGLRSMVSLVRIYDQNKADVIIGSDSDTYLPSVFRNLNGYIGLAQYPSQGQAGRYISINDDDKYNAYPINLIRGVMMHEFGHTLGFRHTDSHTGSHIPATPAYDSGSVMNASANYEFTNGDLKSIYMYYPSGRLRVPVITSSSLLADGRTKINYKFNNIQLTPYWLLIRTFDSSSNHHKVWVRADTDQTGKGSVTVRLNRNKFKVNAVNFKRDKFSKKTDWHTI